MKPSLRENILIESTFVGNLRTCIVSLSLTIALKNYAEKNENIKMKTRKEKKDLLSISTRSPGSSGIL